MLTNSCEVDVPKLALTLIGHLYFEWYVVRCGSKNGYEKDMCLKETRLRIQNMIITLGSIANILEETHITIQ